MDTRTLVAQIDKEIAALQQARAAIASLGDAAPAKRRGRPRKDAGVTPAVKTPKKRHTMSEAGKKAIAAAQKRRWAAQKKSAAKS